MPRKEVANVIKVTFGWFRHMTESFRDLRLAPPHKHRT